VVIEHTFITTMPPEQAMSAASQLLASRGFINAAEVAFRMDGEWTCLEMRRGETSPRKAKSIPELPLSVRMDYDRGRINLALSMPAYRRSFWTGGGEHAPERPQARPHVQLLLHIANALEALLAPGPQRPTVGAEWAALESHLIQEGRARARRRQVVLYLALMFAVAMIVLLIVAVASS
jgi:hypothetical protein